MTIKEIRQKIDELQEITFYLEEEYEMNGGEETEWTKEQEQLIKNIEALLESEGVDAFGRWLVSKEDELQSIQAERNYLTRKIAKTKDTISYIKGQIGAILERTGRAKVKGSCGYTFSPYMSETTEVDKQLLQQIYADRVERALRAADIPLHVHVTLSASVKDLPERTELPLYFKQHKKMSCRFTKPRKTQESA